MSRLTYTAGYRLGMLHGLCIVTAVCCFAWAVFGQTPAQELRAAAADSGRSPEPHYVRYLTAYNLDRKRVDYVAVGNFWVNSLSQRRRLGRMVRVTDTLYRLDLRDYGWNADAWEALVVDLKRPDKRIEPYFAAEHLPADAEYALRFNTNSYGAILRLDYFVARTALEPHYSRFLGLGDKLADVEKQFFVQRDAVKKLGLAQGGAVLESIVALHNRQLERWPTVTGYWWLSRDVRDNRKGKNALENIFAIDHDAGEFIWSLPNGLQAYYLADNQGNQQVEVPADIASDRRTSLIDKRVRNALNCVTCHDVGINPVDDVISRMIRNGATYATKSKDEALALEEYYLSDLADVIQRDNQQFAAAVSAVNGLTTQENARAFETMTTDYLEGRVTLEVAVRETGVSADKLTQAAPMVYSGTLNAILAGEAVARDAWEEIFWRVMVACGQH